MKMRVAFSHGLIIGLFAVVAACHGAPRQKPIKAGPVDTGPQTLTAARTFLEGRWNLESFEVRPPGKSPIVLKGAGTLVYDNMAKP